MSPRYPFLLYGAIAALSALLYFALYNALRWQLGPLTANLLAAAVCVCLSFWANRRLTFGRQGSGRVGREFVEFTVLFASTLAASTAALSLVLASLPPSRLAENLAVAVASLALSVLRYGALRLWVFSPERGRTDVRQPG